ncbi:alpha/beta fold hydrolase [Agromyces laixinhei]|uniref:alpha/beta fold hydrolase n=1 Tax=Agromyces laixinhei TaxID=2585717 RepID=UPI00143CFFD3|nr:alpha/beta fold hydrolase [Agromyces laixinhei]
MNGDVRSGVRVAASVVMAALALAALGACSLPRQLVEGAEEELTEGPFYTIPTPMPEGEPGALVRSEPLPSAPDGVDAWRVLYHSTDLDGADILVSGVVAAPDDAAPDGGRTVVSWGHPTTGTRERCAPSVGFDPFDLIEGMGELIDRGYIVAATDYSGMGAAGPDSFLVGLTEGRNVLDAVRAAGGLDIGASDRVALWGHSQGGHAALFAAQQAADYAPELDVQAVAVAAPAVNLGKLLDADIGDISGVSIASYAFDAYSSVYASTPGIDLDTILTPAAVDAVPRMAELCLFGQNDELHELGQPLIGGFLSADPASTEPWASVLAENTPGGARLEMPLYVAQGATDTLVRPELTAAFVEQQRTLGTEVTSEVLPDTGHGLVALRALSTMLPWLEKTAPAHE